MPLELSVQDLRGFAVQADHELRVSGEGDDLQAEMREGSWRGRAVRNLKIAVGVDRSEKMAGNEAAKNAVFQALSRAYGPEIAKSAFVAGAGHLNEQGNVESSMNHPLTGRQIEKMLQAAEREAAKELTGWIKEELGQPQEDGSVAWPRRGDGARWNGEALRDELQERVETLAEHSGITEAEAAEELGRQVIPLLARDPNVPPDLTVAVARELRALSGATVPEGEGEPPPRLESMRDAEERLEEILRDPGNLDAPEDPAGRFIHALKSCFGQQEGGELVGWLMDPEGERPAWDASDGLPGILQQEAVRLIEAEGPDAFAAFHRAVTLGLAKDPDVPQALTLKMVAALREVDRELAARPPTLRQQLEGLAGSGDRELIGGPDGVTTKAGSLGGRIARNLKIAFGPEGAREGRTEYSGAKNWVLNALKQVYGPELAERAFLAGAGRAREGGGIESSRDHPLTGAQVRRMLEHAEAEVSRYDRSGAPRHASPEDWARRTGAPEGALVRQPDGRAFDRGEDGVLPCSDIAGQMAREIRLQDEADAPGHYFWSLDIGDGESIHLHVDPKDAGTVDVLDPGQREARIPMDRLGGWLAARLGESEAESVTLSRQEQRLAGLYEQRDGRWVADREQALDRVVLGDQVGKEMEKTLNGTYGVGRGCVRDAELITVRTPRGGSQGLTPDTAAERLRTLVGGGDRQADETAMQNLSRLLTRDIPGQLVLDSLRDMAGDGRELLADRSRDELQIEARRVRDDEGREAIEISYREVRHLQSLLGAGDKEELALDPETDRIEADLVLQIPLATLRQPGWEGRLPEPIRATAQLHLERPIGG
ncbi:MAG: hypothetical protein U1E53_15745 [Dongiaceae bacterium]